MKKIPPMLHSALAQARSGYEAAVAGRPATDNPWRVDTMGYKLWARGWQRGRERWRRDAYRPR